MKLNYNMLGSFPFAFRDQRAFIFHSTLSLFWYVLGSFLLLRKCGEREVEIHSSN